MTDVPQESGQTSATPFDDEGFDSTIRRVQHDGHWYFSVIDIVGVLSDAPTPRMYWADMKRRIVDEGFRELLAKCQQLKLKAADGKLRATECADTAQLLATGRRIREATTLDDVRRGGGSC